ncbi:MAG: phage tail tape measure protein, partial [Clostridia bacterium]|nr:phage tail tape measure protein [Clostridia bacterium]
MAGAIKGITVEIGGETSGLDKALQGVNKESASIAKELREVDKLLEFDGSNVDILAQKQELLGKAVETAAEKVQKLHDVQAEVEEQFKSGKISGEAYRDFQREVAKAEAALRKAETAVDD